MHNTSASREIKKKGGERIEDLNVCGGVPREREMKRCTRCSRLNGTFATCCACVRVGVACVVHLCVFRCWSHTETHRHRRRHGHRHTDTQSRVTSRHVAYVT